MKKMITSHKTAAAFLAVCFGVLLVLPHVVSNYYVALLCQIFLFACFALAWNLIGGYGAQISWCHSAFVAMGAYANFILASNYDISPWLTMPLGAAVAYVLASIIGYGTFRLRGSYFSIATIAFAEAARLCINYFKDITKGSAGIYVTYKGNSLAALTFKTDKPFYYISLILMILVLIVTYLFTQSKTGKYLGAIKGDEDAAESLGIETFKVKLTAFQLSAMLCAIAGSIYASYMTYISPFAICGLDLSIKIGIIAIVGGVGTLFGPVLGAFVVIPLIEATSKLLGNTGGSQLLYGLLLIVIVIFRPKGLISLIVRDKDESSGKVSKKIAKAVKEGK